MPTFDRFDVCAAYHMYAVGYNGEPYANEIGCRLSALKYKPSHSEEYLCGLSENARDIYAGLVQREHHDQCGYNPCACATCFDIAIGAPGVALCHDCASAGCEPGCGECPACRGRECQCEPEPEGDE